MDRKKEGSAPARPLPGTQEAEDARLALHGGSPVRRTPWPTYDKGAVFVHPEDEEAALRAIRSHLYFRYDYRAQQETECGKFEEELCRYFGSKHALAVSSGTTALALAIMAAGIPQGSLIACPGFTFVATPSAIVLAGCTPLLVEVDENLHMDLADLRRRWTPEIKGILVVHMRGFAADMEALTRFAAEMGVPVFEDAVPALGAELKGRKLGTFGIAGAFSTQSDKSLNCGEGGFLVTDDSTLFARAVVLSGAYEGRLRRHFPDGEPPISTDLDLPLLSFRMDEIRAALLRAEMERLPIRLQRFRSNYAYVSAALSDLTEIAIRQPVAPGAYLGEAFIFRVPGGDAKWFAHALCCEGIDARNLGSDEDTNVRVFWNWRFMFDTKDVATIKALLPDTKRYLEEAVDIPLSSSLSAEDCDHLVKAVRKVAGAVGPDRRRPDAARDGRRNGRDHAPDGQGAGRQGEPAPATAAAPAPATAAASAPAPVPATVAASAPAPVPATAAAPVTAAADTVRAGQGR
ncbi:DegT/DnrJ/EryC1/StrS family aminotransferase [Streptosporangium minutum]|uniref:DegT/DnrJ/EryC1/StrS aminotransferase n=1 Tax=Streptosporangium minutum TaxID=569862 RepID=A0A243RUD4_9ACTN|nr:aminotransferase class I/II-fold pyridoxal phosphate-dependent enzyme [Streptosporangium minutum]OUC98783.1 DegT/DnrJ/EryC1/StrS aminotransferase [Streptosporangium minutum]